jgi:hypothetical protein
MASGRMERILILPKTYPSLGAQYVETSCVAASQPRRFDTPSLS